MNKTILSTKQSELLENLIVKHGQIVTSHQIFESAYGSWDYKQAKNLITKFVKDGWLIRIKRGLYAISDLSTRGFLALSSYAVANLLNKDSYVSFESALQYHGFFDQLTNKTVSVSIKTYQTVTLQDVEYSFIKTKASQYFGWQEVNIDNHMVRIASIEKALIDMVNFHKNQYAIDLVIEKLLSSKNNIDFNALTDHLSKFSLATIKIFGFMFDLIGLDSTNIYQLTKAKHGTHWMFAGDKTFNAKWRLYYDAYFDKYTSSL